MSPGAFSRLTVTATALAAGTALATVVGLQPQTPAGAQTAGPSVSPAAQPMTSMQPRSGGGPGSGGGRSPGSRLHKHTTRMLPPPLGTVPCPAQQHNLIEMPVIKTHPGLPFRATMKVVDGVRTVWRNTNDPACDHQRMRFYVGFDPMKPSAWPSGAEPIPGPTLRARVGDLVEIMFFNEVDTSKFAGTLDRGTVGTSEACDTYTTGGRARTNGDTMPDCLHGSSTTNIHFHGTHTTPSTTGDNVLLFVRPRVRDAKGVLRPTEGETQHDLSGWFTDNCEKTGPATTWKQLPQSWRALQAELVKRTDDTTAYQGKIGGLPESMRLSTVDQQQIKLGAWPQYQIGASPYCFRLPAKTAALHMGQSPGTHWYHAHKHGSTALNVANGMEGVLIIEGDYDDALHAYYKANGLRERVLMLQQLSTNPFPITNGTGGPPGAPRARISVNGSLDPVVEMRPGEVQMWRVVNGAFRDAVQFAYFKAQPSSAPRGTSDTLLCNLPNTPLPPATVTWRQIAQDGVQFIQQNYDQVGTVNAQFNLAPANRADLLVKAPTQPGLYALCAVANQALLLDNGSLNPASPGAAPKPPRALLTVSVTGSAVSPAMDFIPDSAFPKQPAFLSDITSSEIKRHRTLTFGNNNNTIDGHPFLDGHIDQQMVLNTAEEWIVANNENDKSHPFHIHINPFQILEVFQPNDPAAQNPKNQDGTANPCYVDPTNPDTWDPARPGFTDQCNLRVLPGPWVWWDTFAIPTARTMALPSTFCTTVSQCLTKLGNPNYSVSCKAGKPCGVVVNGWFRMRSRFVDFTGQYVLHCHILIHEDRGMMQLVEVTATPSSKRTTIYRHH
jgi:FtsP/CotA-like multicopper oxidase with cupredoxin domain